MGPNTDSGKGTLYINGEPVVEVEEIKISLEAEPSDFPPILTGVSFTVTMDCPRWLRRKLEWWIFKARLKALAVETLQKLEQIWNRCKHLICDGGSR